MQYKKSNIIGMGFVSFFTDPASFPAVPLLPFFVVLILEHGVDKLGLVLAITTLVSHLLWRGAWSEFRNSPLSIAVLQPSS
ncbi:hypothetical protein ABF162_24885 (plasmid) [Vibrio coralliilyticus]|uniref:hypothetical protein n=1 Tax=Vibrio coralliilyticus TaxID=190893 RepID=UPI0009B89DB0|nr:hypothetical protein [Vibrio coralliilyticus]